MSPGGSVESAAGLRGDTLSLRQALRAARPTPAGFLWGRDARVPLRELVAGTSLGGRLRELSGRSVLLCVGDPLAAALALIDLDGVARRIVLCPPDLAPDRLPLVAASAEADAIVADAEDAALAAAGVALRVTARPAVMRGGAGGLARWPTEWLTLTMDAAGALEMTGGPLAHIAAAVESARPARHDVVWGTFDDMRASNGLPVFVRAVLDGTSLVLPQPGEPVAEHLLRLSTAGVTHLAGTPAQWHRALGSAAVRAIAPRRVYVSGAEPGRALHDRLRVQFPRALIGSVAGPALEDRLQPGRASRAGTR